MSCDPGPSAPRCQGLPHRGRPAGSCQARPPQSRPPARPALGAPGPRRADPAARAEHRDRPPPVLRLPRGSPRRGALDHLLQVAAAAGDRLEFPPQSSPSRLTLPGSASQPGRGKAQAVGKRLPVPMRPGCCSRGRPGSTTLCAEEAGRGLPCVRRRGPRGLDAPEVVRRARPSPGGPALTGRPALHERRRKSPPGACRRRLG